MRVESAFDKNVVEQHGYTMDTVYNTIKKTFAAKRILCVDNRKALVFEDNGGENDFVFGKMKVSQKVSKKLAPQMA